MTTSVARVIQENTDVSTVNLIVCIPPECPDVLDAKASRNRQTVNVLAEKKPLLLSI